MGAWRWYRQDRAHVEGQLRAGRRPDMAATTALGPLDALAALHDEVGAFAALTDVPRGRARAGLDDALLLRTLAVRPFVGHTGRRGVAAQRCRDPAVLLQVGGSPLARSGAAAWQPVQRAGVRGRSRHRLVRGGLDAVDGTGRSATQRVVARVCLSGAHPLVVAWRSLAGRAAEQGQAASVTKARVAPVRALGGPATIDLLLAAARDAAGPRLAWRKCVHGVDALVRLPADRLRDADVQGLAASGRLTWQEHRDARPVRGHQARRTVALAGTGAFARWPSFSAAAAGDGRPDARLGACLVRERAPAAQPRAEAAALVSTRDWARPQAAFLADRGRWALEDDPSRARKAGWGRERAPWGTRSTTAHGRVTLTLLACNTAQLDRTQGGQRLADTGLRRLRQRHQHDLGAAPVVVYVDGGSGVFALEEVLAFRGAPVQQSLRPNPRPARPPTHSP